MTIYFDLSKSKNYLELMNKDYDHMRVDTPCGFFKPNQCRMNRAAKSKLTPLIALSSTVLELKTEFKVTFLKLVKKKAKEAFDYPVDEKNDFMFKIWCRQSKPVSFKLTP